MITRRTFLKTAAAATAAFGIASPARPNVRTNRLAFSTIGCPDWDLRQAAVYAHKHGYKGIEIRGVQRELDLTKAREFYNAEARRSTRSLMADFSLDFVGFGASTQLHVKDKADRQKQLDEAKRFIDLAAELNCPYVRVFPNKLPKEEEKAETLDRITAGLLELGAYASGTGVIVLLETHGDVVYSDDLFYIMQAAKHPQTALLWDIFNMWVVTGESPASVYQRLSPFIRHVHLKDGRRGEKGPHHTLMGAGAAPIGDAIQLLDKGSYDGYYSFEWEKLWHPELAEPEEAFADYVAFMKRFN